MRITLQSWWRGDFEMSQQRGECLLLGPIVLPTSEVADMAGFSERCCPTCCTVKDGIIKVNGKEHFSLFTVFSGEGEFDFATGIHFGMAS
jgi:hypothetical protein